MVTNLSFNRPKIALLSSGDADDPLWWSGTPYYMARALDRHVGDVSFLGPVRLKRQILGRLLNRTLQTTMGKQYDHTHSVFMAKGYARAFADKLTGRNLDLIVAPGASTETAFLETKFPIVYASDATFARMVNYQPGFSRLLSRSIRDGNLIEKTAITKAALLIYPTAWAASSSLTDYGADPKKVFVVPFGANLEEPTAKETASQRKKSECCHLLFLGTNWERKGGLIALETLLQLEKAGLPANLTVCGTIPPSGFSHPKMNVVPFLDKNDPKQRKKLAELYLDADFLLLPTRYECYGIVFCEAAAFGLSVITTDTGGVTGVVENGVNGYALPYDAGGADYARLIAEIYADDARYYALVHQSRSKFEERLNWDAWAKTVRRLISENLGIG